MDWSTGVVNFAEDAHPVANNLQMAGGVGALITTGAQLVAKRACTEFIKLTAKAVAGIAASNAIGALTDRAVKLAQLLGVTVDPYYLRAACERLQVVSLWKAARAKRKAADAQCFVAGTEVLTGSAGRPGVFGERRIEDVRAGDLVWAKDQYDPSAPLELKRVVQTFAHKATDLQAVEVRDETGNVETLHVTDEHPFYVDGRGWTGAADLQRGDQLVSPDGRGLTVVGNADERHAGGVMVYNFEVEGAHTYFVADGVGLDSFVWAHNRCTTAEGSAEELAHNPGSARAQLREALGLFDPNVEAHHLLPRALFRSPENADVATVLHQAAKGGFHFNSSRNGAPLPKDHGIGPNTGVHNQYTADVATTIRQRLAGRSSVTDSQARAIAEEVADEFRNRLPSYWEL